MDAMSKRARSNAANPVPFLVCLESLSFSSDCSTPPDFSVEQTQEVSPVEELEEPKPKRRKMLATYKLARAAANAAAGSDAAQAKVEEKKEPAKEIIDLTKDEPPKKEPEQLFASSNEEDAIEEEEQTLPQPQPQSGWRPKLAPIAQPNYIYDHPRSRTDLDETWNYSPSMKGWTRMECIVCGKFCTKDEQHAVLQAMQKLPLELKRDQGILYRYKCRGAAVCFKCRTTLHRRLTANPQMYNGRGTCYFIIPM